MYLRPAL